MIGIGNEGRPPAKMTSCTDLANGIPSVHKGNEELRLRVQQLSLREQIERNHFLLLRLNAANARLIQSLDQNDVFEAITEIIANLVGSEKIAVFDFHPADQSFSLAWSSGVESESLQPFLSGAGMFGRAVQQGSSQFRERQQEMALLSHEKDLTACVLLKSSGEIVGVIAIFELLPQKNNLEWADFELLKFLEIYGAVAIKFQRLQRKQVSP